MSNLYDIAYQMEKAVRTNPDYIALRDLRRVVEADEITKKLYEQFREIQMKFYSMQMMGQEVPEEEMQAAQLTITAAQQNKQIADLLNAEQRFSMVWEEVFKIMMQPIQELNE